MTDIHICTQMPLPPEAIARAAALAVAENPANALAHATLLAERRVAAMADLPPREYLALPTGKLWAPGRTLRVWLDGGSAFVRAKVQQYATAWCAYANLQVTFVPSGAAEIRVGFVQGVGSWSYIGTDNLSIAPPAHTMNFGWFTDQTDDGEFSRVMIHEFGHAIGCIHEHQSPAANIPWNKPAVYAYYQRTQSWTQQQVDANIFQLYSATTTQYSAFDTSSIMLYAIPADLTLNGFSTGWNRVLSTTDELFAEQVYPSKMRVLHQGSAHCGELWTVGSNTGEAWGRDTQVRGVGMSEGPSTVWFNGALYVFHQGYGLNGELWYRVLGGNGAVQDVQVPGTGMSGSPSAVVFGGKLYCFHQGYHDSGELWFNTFDGQTWSGDTRVPNTGMSSGPSAVVFGGKLYCFHQGYGLNGTLWFNVFDGSGWAGDQQVPNTGMSSGPSAVVFAGKLHCFHQGQSNNGSLWVNVFDGQGWLGDTQVPNTGMSASPAAAVLGGSLYCFHQGEGDAGTLWVNRFDGSAWAGDRQVPDVGMTSGPGVAVSA